MPLCIKKPHQYKHTRMITYQPTLTTTRYIQPRVQVQQTIAYVWVTNTLNNGIVGKARTERHTMMIATRKEQPHQQVVTYRSRQQMR